MLSAIVLTKNEEKNIGKCLESLNWCDEVLVIDDYSTDTTANIAKKYGARVFKRSLNDDFAKQRNFGLKKVKGEWVLFVDADERISGDLASEIKEKIVQTNEVGFYIRRRDFLWGRELKHGEVGKAEFIRFGKKNAGSWKRKVHEFWEIHGEVGKLDTPLRHYPHQTIREFVEHIEYFSTLHAQERRREGEKASFLKVIVWPLAKFFRNWIVKLGFLDGTQGFLVAILMSFHSFLSWSKLWLMQKSNR
ncbi:hypothetical protein CMO96_02715 [Candidatus Woesebacteria bacterium]|nr:hypothetical protein [Candidatus Woesebacteria bacterium]|tara:strand:- start:495 stop:1238 length:744 start_codon:yes stop_codon:yes gene_type:complete